VKYTHVHAIDNPRTQDNQEYNLGLARAEAKLVGPEQHIVRFNIDKVSKLKKRIEITIKM